MLSLMSIEAETDAKIFSVSVFGWRGWDIVGG
jgi:hypothetical protein